jgi:cytochrome c551/c552
MRIRITLGVLFLVMLAAAGCGGKKAEETQATSAPPPAAAPAADYVVPADLDQGPRAGESPVDAALAAQGEQLFQTRGCVACHAFGKKVIGPDLKGVAMQRTQRWMEAQIMHPDKMTVQDPTAKALLAEFKTQMTNQGLTEDQAKAVIEYIKKAGK